MSQPPFGNSPQNPFGNAPQNPYQTPQRPMGPGPGPRPIDKVKIPAILLMVAGGIGVMVHLLGICLHLFGIGAGAAGQAGNDPQMLMIQSVGGIIGGIVGLTCDGIVIFGASNMMKMQNWGFSLTAAIVAMLPCISCGCLLGLPIGIWSIVVLSDANVKRSFR